VALDAFISKKGADLIKIKCSAGKATTPNVELFAIHLSILQAIQLKRVETILIFTDTIALVHACIDSSTHSGQSHSLAMIGVLKPWLEADSLHKVKFWYILSLQQ
jgi:hypothetical protein